MLLFQSYTGQELGGGGSYRRNRWENPPQVQEYQMLWFLVLWKTNSCWSTPFGNHVSSSWSSANIRTHSLNLCAIDNCLRNWTLPHCSIWASQHNPHSLSLCMKASLQPVVLSSNHCLLNQLSRNVYYRKHLYLRLDLTRPAHILYLYCSQHIRKGQHKCRSHMLHLYWANSCRNWIQ